MKQLIQRCGVFLMILLLISGVLSSCGTEEGNKVEFTEPAPPSSSGTDEITSIAPSPGHIVIGQMDPNQSVEYTISEEMLSTYSLSSQATMEIRNFRSEKELIEAARRGEIDILFGNPLVSSILGYEDSLTDLKSVLSNGIETELYYDNIIHEGEIHDKLVMIVPLFRLENAIMVPSGVIDTIGKIPGNFSEVIQIYDMLEPEYRSYGTEVYSSIPVLQAAINLQNHSFDITPYWDSWTNLLQKTEEDGVSTLLYQNNERYVSLFSTEYAMYFSDPTYLHNIYQKINGKTYTQYGPRAILLPFAYEDEMGFGIGGATYSVPEHAANKEAALHFIQWIMSEEWQAESRQYQFGCPVMKSEAEKWFLKFRSHPENMYTVEEQQAIAEAYIAQADHIPVYSRTLYETVYELLDATGGKDVRDEYVNMLTTTEVSENLGGEEYAENNAARAENWKILFEFFEKFENEESTPKFYQEGALDIWPELVNDYVRAYITDLGYEMH